MFFCIAGHVLASFCIAGHFLASFLIAGHVFCIAFNRGTKIQKQAAATQTVLRHGVTAVTGPRRRRRCSWRPADRPCGRRRCRCTHRHPSNHAGAAATLTAARISSPARLSPAATAAVQREKWLRQQQWHAGARQEADGGGGDNGCGCSGSVGDRKGGRLAAMSSAAAAIFFLKSSIRQPTPDTFCYPLALPSQYPLARTWCSTRNLAT